MSTTHNKLNLDQARLYGTLVARPNEPVDMDYGDLIDTLEALPSYTEFVRGVTGALDHVRANHHGQNVLLVSSGGPISTAVGHVLGLSPEATIELNLRIRNSAVTEFQFNPKRHTLLSYNTLPHLDRAEFRDWMTYA